MIDRENWAHPSALTERLRGGLWAYYLGFGLGRLATVTVLPIVSRSLGPEELGYFEPALAVLLAAMIIGDAGMGAAVVRFYGDPRYPPASLLGAAGTLQLLASLIAFVALAGPLVIIAPPGSSRLATLAALALFAVVEGLAVVGAGLVRATDRNGLYLALSVLRVGVAAGVGAIGVRLGGPVGALFGVALAGIGFAAVAVRTVAQSQNWRGTKAARYRLLRYGPPMMTASLMTWMLSLSDRVLLRAWTSPLELARYSASYRLGGVVTMFIAAPLALAWLPVARKVETREQLTRLCLSWASRFAVCSLGSGALLVAASGTLVPLIFGAKLQADHAVVAAVTVSGWLFGLYFLIATRIMLSESTKQLAGVAVAVTLFNLACNPPLIYAWGARGAALATVLSYLVLCIVAGVSVWRLEPARWLFNPLHMIIVTVLLVILALAVVTPRLALLTAVLGAVLLGKRLRAAV